MHMAKQQALQWGSGCVEGGAQRASQTCQSQTRRYGKSVLDDTGHW